MSMNSWTTGTTNNNIIIPSYLHGGWMVFNYEPLTGQDRKSVHLERLNPRSLAMVPRVNKYRAGVLLLRKQEPRIMIFPESED